jgi:hypothetical protein
MPSNNVAFDVKDILVAAGVGMFGSNSGWSIFIGIEPDMPIETVTLYDTPGDAPHPRWLLDYPRFQVRTRSLSYDAGYKKAEHCKSALLGFPSQDFNGSRYVGIYTVLDTHFLNTDSKGRSIFINTWRCIREPMPAVGDHRLPL